MMKLISLLICIFLGTFFSAAFSQAKSLDEGMSLLNEEKYKEASEIFREFSEQGNAKASYWLAYTQFKTSNTLEAGSSLLKSAEGGNPWAMATLAGTDMPEVDRSFCGFLGWPCDEQWVDRAIEGWEKLAEEGDGKAMYALLYHDPSWWQYIPIYRDYRYGQLASKLYNHKGYAFFYDSHFWSWINEDIRLKYLEEMAKKGNMVAVYKAAFLYKDLGDVETALRWIDYGVRENDFNALTFKSIIFIPYMREYETGSEAEKTSKKAYFYCMVAHEINKSYDCTIETFFDDVYGEGSKEPKYFSRYTGEEITKEEIRSIEKSAKQRAEGLKANLYLDETTVEFFKGFRKNL